MTERPEGLRFDVEWLDAPAVRSPELRTTWCRLQIWVHDDCVTRVEEAATGSARRSIYVPLYPLAEWVAYNWWQLVRDSRPTSAPTCRWSYSRLRDEGGRNSWLRAHNLRAAGEGFPWPNLTIVPEGEYARVAWVRDDHVRRQGISYSSSGHALVDRAQLVAALVSLVEAVLGRLADEGVASSQLSKEWDALQELSTDEVEFAEAAARLGLDPFDIPSDTAEALLRVADELTVDPLRADFLDSVRPGELQHALAWVQKAQSAVNELPRPGQRDVSSLRSVVASISRSASRPWEAGYLQARAVRRELGVSNLNHLDVSAFVSTGLLRGEKWGLQGFGSTDGHGCRVLLPHAYRPTSGRFAGARALWHALALPSYREFLLTRSHATRQKTERAFAAELLAPMSGITAVLGDISSVDDSDDLEDLAERYGVSAMVIQHQIENAAA